MPSFFVLPPFVYVLINLYYSAKELDDLYLVKLRTLTSCRKPRFNHKGIYKLELLRELELKPDFVENLLFSAVINLLIAYLPLLFKI